MDPIFPPFLFLQQPQPILQASRSYVLDNGKIAMQAESKDLLQNSEFKRIYMGL